jgi:hypothetical protein
MPVDNLLVLQASTTVVATTTGTALTIPYGTPGNRPLYARIPYSAFSAATGTSTVTFSITNATDATNFVTLATAQPLLASSAATAGEVVIPFVSPMAAHNSSTDAIKLVATFSGSGVTTPTITYNGYIGIAQP